MHSTRLCDAVPSLQAWSVCICAATGWLPSLLREAVPHVNKELNQLIHLLQSHQHNTRSIERIPTNLTLMKEFCSTSNWLRLSVVRSILTVCTANFIHTCGSLLAWLFRTLPLSVTVGNTKLRNETCSQRLCKRMVLWVRVT